MFAVNFPYFVGAPYRFGFYSATFNHCHESCCCSTCHLHTHRHTHTQAHRELHTTGACVVYIGSTWRVSQPTTGIHVAYIARYIHTATRGRGRNGADGGWLGWGRPLSSSSHSSAAWQALAHILWPDSAYNVARLASWPSRAS